MTRTFPLSHVKVNLSRLVADVIRRDDEIIITRNGKPAAVLMSAEEFESWKETQEIKQNSDLMREIRRGLKALHRKKGSYEIKELFGHPLKGSAL